MKPIIGMVMASLLAISTGFALTACDGEQDRCDAFLDKMMALTPEEARDEGEEEELANLSDEEKEQACENFTEEQMDCVLDVDEDEGLDGLMACGLAGAAE